MKAKDIIATYKRLKYYNNTLEPLLHKMDTLTRGTEAQRNKFIRETDFVTKLFMARIYDEAMDNYNPVENPLQKITKNEVIALVSSQETKDKGINQRDNYNFVYIEKLQFLEFIKAFKALVIR